MLYRLLFPEAIWRLRRNKRKVVFLTFDDGPIPEVTPWVLDLLDSYHIKATFFMVGDNVKRNPDIYEEVRRRGHSIGNHTMHHLQGFKVQSIKYWRDITQAAELIDSRLFRPPHGLIRWRQAKAIKKHYNIVMYDLVTRDYSNRLGWEDVFNNVKTFARNGSIIVFHDSLKAQANLIKALPAAIDWLKEQGYEFLPLDM